MTELETMQRAKMYMDKLAQGIDPISNVELPEDSTLNNVRLARCFFYVSGVLGKVIDNGGVVGGNGELPFSITAEQLSGVMISREPIPVSRLAEAINAAVDNPRMKKFSAGIITNWLLQKGFLERQVSPDGKSRRFPTSNGTMIGLSSELRRGMNREYEVVLYNTQAQRFVLDHLSEMLGEGTPG